MAKVDVYHMWRRLLFAMAVIAVPALVCAQHTLHVIGVDKDSSFFKEIGIQREFKTQAQCTGYIYQIPGFLQAKGYLNASIDSIRVDSLSSTIHLYVGDVFAGSFISMDSVDQKLLDAVGWNPKNAHKAITFAQMEGLRQKLLTYLENNGYPFARIELDSAQLSPDKLNGILRVHKGPLYKIDSIRNHGTARISENFLQRHLNMLNGTIYRRDKLATISTKISELPFVSEQQPWNLTMLGTGSILNLYLVPKKSSQVNVLVGFLPSNEQLSDNKLLVTGEANVNLKNALGGGESIGLNWQQIQVKSPRLNLAFQQPYLFSSPFGISFNFDLLKKDSSYVNINTLLGVQYALSSNYVTSVFFQSFSTNLLTVDTFAVKNSRRLPQEADLRSINVGVNVDFFNTDYRFNPRSGNEIQVSLAVGTKKIRKNNVIVQLQDHTDPSYNFNRLYDTVKLKSYEFRIKLSGAHFFRLGRASTLKAAVHGGWYESPNIFRNELFQIGGYKLLRGFDEESIFASRYGVGTLEYRYLMGMNSFLFAFVDGGWAGNRSVSVQASNSFIGAGLGMAFETKAGIFNISYAAGKRDDTKFNLRQSKIHLGYVNFF